MTITIKKEIPQQLIPAAARIYAEAFQRKFIKLIGDIETTSKLFQKSFNPKRAVCAINEKGELVGIAGFHMHQHSLAEMNLKQFIKEFGFINGSIKGILAHLFFSRKPAHSKEFLMDGIAVSSSYRGMGVGTLLFQALMEVATENNFEWIKLDVIDENPKAKKLYSRIGFKTERYKKLPRFVHRLIGVSGVTTMTKTIGGKN